MAARTRELTDRPWPCSIEEREKERDREVFLEREKMTMRERECDEGEREWERCLPVFIRRKKWWPYPLGMAL